MNHQNYSIFRNLFFVINWKGLRRTFVELEMEKISPSCGGVDVKFTAHSEWLRRRRLSEYRDREAGAGGKCIQNESAKDIKLTDAAWPCFGPSLGRQREPGGGEGAEESPGVSSYNPDFSVSCLRRRSLEVATYNLISKTHPGRWSVSECSSQIF